MLIHMVFLIFFLNICLCEDYYELLGVAKDAEIRDIRKAFKKLALVYHPDKNKDKDAHKAFIDINIAYEVLKDTELRKKYDLYGKEGLKEDFRKPWEANYHSWNYYHEKFGIYDDDPEIVTLSLSDFERFVLDSSDVWFVNFYSPQCSHCHILAPTWRKLARELQGVIQIGAVNCEEDWMLCRKQNVFSYPSLMLYKSSRKMKYGGSREVEDLVDYVLQNLPYNVIQLTSANYKKEISNQKIHPLPWLIFSFERSKSISKDDLKKLSIILEHLVYVAEINDHDDKHICTWLFCDSPITYFSNLTTSTGKMNLQKVFIDDFEVIDIVNKVLHLLPELQEISSSNLEKIQRASKDTLPWLIQFIREEDISSINRDIHLKRLKSFLPNINLGLFNCLKNSTMCTSLYIVKYPSFVLFRPDGSHEFYHGRITAYDVSRFVHEALKSRVHTLNPQHFPKVTHSEEIWFIDFFAPWCPPCMMLLPEYQKVSQYFDQSVKFGSVDCTVHRTLCLKYNIKSYPSVVLYKNSVGHKYQGLYNHNELNEFIQDILNPAVISLDPSSFEENVSNKNDIWVVAFSAPWCESCQVLSPQWRKLAKMLLHLDYVHIGEVNCQKYPSFCNSLGVNRFPSIRLYPKSNKQSGKFFLYDDLTWDATILRAWVHEFLPSVVLSLSDNDFQNVLNDSEPWVIDFFAPWCGHCQVYAPEFEKIAKKIEGKVKAGKINCVEFPRTCRSASIHSYPSVVFYRGRTGSKPQSPVAEEIQPFLFDNVISFLQNKLNSKFKEFPVRDEL